MQSRKRDNLSHSWFCENQREKEICWLVTPWLFFAFSCVNNIEHWRMVCYTWFSNAEGVTFVDLFTSSVNTFNIFPHPLVREYYEIKIHIPNIIRKFKFNFFYWSIMVRISLYIEMNTRKVNRVDMVPASSYGPA